MGWVQAVVAIASLVPAWAGLRLFGHQRRQSTVRADLELLNQLPGDSTQRHALLKEVDRQIETMLAERHGPTRRWIHVAYGAVLLLAALWLWGTSTVTEAAWLRVALRAEAVIVTPVGLGAIILGLLRRQRGEDGLPVISGDTLWERVRSLLLGA